MSYSLSSKWVKSCLLPLMTGLLGLGRTGRRIGSTVSRTSGAGCARLFVVTGPHVLVWEPQPNLARTPWLWGTFGNSGSLQHYGHEQGEGGTLASPRYSREK